MKRWLSVFWLLLFVTPPAAARDAWPERLRKEVERIDKSLPGDLGVYVKDTSTGTTYSHRGQEWWYYASATKLFVLIEVMRLVEQKKLSLAHEVTISSADYRDGAGRVNWQAPGTKLSVQFLIDQMMQESDNAATDLLIGLIDINHINSFIRDLAGENEIGGITPLLDVRKEAYGLLHPKAAELTNLDYITIKNAKTSARRLNKFLELTGLRKKDLKLKSVEDAFEKYYSGRKNGGTLRAYAAVLEALVNGQVISPRRSQEIIEILSRCKTGKTRVRAGLPTHARWAHKTGTQLNRICDMGIVLTGNRKIIVTTCAKGFKSLTAAESAMKRLGQALSKSGLLINPSKKSTASKI